MDKDISICKQVATETVAIVSEKLDKTLSPAEFLGLSNKFVNWILKQGKTKDVLICRQAALRRAAMSINACNLKTSDKILEFADILNDYYNGLRNE